MRSKTSFSRFMALAPAAFITLLIQGCSDKIDFRQTQDTNGLRYKLGSTEPFSGTVRNYPQPRELLTNVSCSGEMQFKDGLEVGTFECNTEDGTKLIESEFRNGKKNGITRFWDEKTGKLFLEVEFKSDRIVGKPTRLDQPQSSASDQQQAVPSVASKKNPAEINACVDTKVMQFRKEKGDDAMVSNDMLTEWTDGCK